MEKNAKIKSAKKAAKRHVHNQNDGTIKNKRTLG